MASLQEQLEEERRKKGLEKSTTTPSQLTPQDREALAVAEIKAFKAEQDRDSVKSGYENFKVREKTIVDREANISQREDALKKDIGEFELEQKTRLASYNANVEKYNQAFAMLQTERTEAKKLMEEALSQKSQADIIIKAQTEAETLQAEKNEAYKANMEEAVTLLSEMAKFLRRQDADKALGLAGLLNKDLDLITRLQTKNAPQQTLADIISVDCDRVLELCEFLQESKSDSSATNYLLEGVEWLQNALKIEWTPNESEGVLR
jgi:hypothetical protein